jgi:hypothetical protein
MNSARAQSCDAGTISITPTSVCVGTNVTFSSTSSSTALQWQIFDGTSWQTAGIGNPFSPGAPNTPGIFQIRAIANGLCTPDTSNILTVAVNALPVVNLGSDATVCGGTILNAGPGMTSYAWSTGATTQTINVTATGTYSVTVTNPNGCSNSDTVAITVNTQPLAGTIASDAPNNQLCENDTITLNATGFTGNIQWFVMENNMWNSIGSGPTTSGSVDSAATYQVIAVASLTNGCPNDTSAILTVVANALPMVNLGNNATVCGGTVLNAGPGMTSYAWSTGATTQILGVVSTGTYSVTVTDPNGCSNSDTVSITVNSLPIAGTISSSAVNNQLCAMDSITLTATGTTGNIEWQVFENNMWDSIGSGTTLGPEQVDFAGVYPIIAIATLPNGCPADTSNMLSITVNALPVINLGSDVTVCGSTMLDAGPGMTSYAWSNGGTTQMITVTSTGTYIAEVTNANGCSNADTINVTVNMLPEAGTITSDAVNNQLCVGDSIGFSSTGATGTINWYVFENNQWNQMGTGNPLNPGSPDSAGVYLVNAIATLPNGCPADTSNTLTITVHSLPVVNLGNDTTVCGYIILNAGPGMTSYTWSSGNTTQFFTATSSGTYIAEVMNANGCMNADTINVTVNTLPNAGTLTTSAANNQLCVNDSITLTTSGSAGNIEWFVLFNNAWDSIGSGTMVGPASIDSVATYQVITVASFGNGCPNDTSAILMVTASNPPAVNLGSDITACGSALLDAGNPGATYQWSNSSTTQTTTVTSSGQYIVTVTVNGCGNSDTIGVTINPLPNVTLASMNTVCVDDLPFTLSGGSPAGGTYSGTGVSGSSFDPGTAGTGTHSITYTVTGANGCTNSASQNIVVNVCVGISNVSGIASDILAYPNPSEGMITISSEWISSSQLEVYNLLQQKVMETKVSASTLTIDLTGKPGVYTLRFTKGNEIKVAKIVVRN